MEAVRELRPPMLVLNPPPWRLPRSCGASIEANLSAAVTPVSRIVCSRLPTWTLAVRTAAGCRRAVSAWAGEPVRQEEPLPVNPMTISRSSRSRAPQDEMGSPSRQRGEPFFGKSRRGDCIANRPADTLQVHGQPHPLQIGKDDLTAEKVMPAGPEWGGRQQAGEQAGGVTRSSPPRAGLCRAASGCRSAGRGAGAGAVGWFGFVPSFSVID